MVDVGQPNAVTEFHQMRSSIIYPRGVFHFVRRTEIGITTRKRNAKPHFVFLDQRKYFLVGHAIHVADDDELFVGGTNPRQKLAKQRKRWVGDDEVGLVA